MEARIAHKVEKTLKYVSVGFFLCRRNLAVHTLVRLFVSN